MQRVFRPNRQPARVRPGHALAALAALCLLVGTAACSSSKDSPGTATDAETQTSGGAATATEAPTVETSASNGSNGSGLPSIQDFRKNPSDRLPVDSVLVRSGHPFKGKNANTPHTGAHIVFGSDYEDWPQNGDAPENYPPIYAVADGIVSRVDNTFAVGDNDRYGINLSIATNGSSTIDFEYSIEPMVKEPSTGFYANFIKVKVGDRVKRGDVIAYMYLPKDVTSSHIHFELINTATGEFMAPAIFSRPTLAEFYGTWRDQGFDSNQGYENPIPICMGWKIVGSENPYENKDQECLSYPAESGA